MLQGLVTLRVRFNSNRVVHHQSDACKRLRFTLIPGLDVEPDSMAENKDHSCINGVMSRPKMQEDRWAENFLSYASLLRTVVQIRCLLWPLSELPADAFLVKILDRPYYVRPRTGLRISIAPVFGLEMYQ
jgi:hypothetical protein